MSNAKVYYLLNEDGRKKSLLTGGDGKELQCFCTEVTKELLDLECTSVNEEGEVTTTIGFKFGINKKPLSIVTDFKINTSFGNPSIDKIDKIIRFEEPMELDDLIEFQKNKEYEINKSCEEVSEKYEEVLNNYRREQYIKRIKEENQQRVEKEQKEMLEKQRKERKEKEYKEDIKWINENGSDYLKNMIVLNYKFKRAYVTERVEKELPDFEIDFEDNADWKERVSPSEEAINEILKLKEQGHDATIVWLTSPINKDDYDFEQKEAIYINFRDYNLIKEL